MMKNYLKALVYTVAISLIGIASIVFLFSNPAVIGLIILGIVLLIWASHEKENNQSKNQE